LEVVELVEQFQLPLLQIVVFLLIRSKGLRVGEVRDLHTAIEVLMLRPFNSGRLLWLLKQLLSSLWLKVYLLRAFCDC
jgi:hypothetical protein